MSKGSKPLVQNMDTLIEVTENLRKVLLRYEKVSAQLAARVERGEALVDVLGEMHGPVLRGEVTDALIEVEEARHNVRLAMFALGEEQGTSQADRGGNWGSPVSLRPGWQQKRKRCSPSQRQYSVDPAHSGDVLAGVEGHRPT